MQDEVKSTQEQKQVYSQAEYNSREIRITGTAKIQKMQLINIADHLGQTLNAFMKSQLPDILAKYPEHYRDPIDKS